MIPTHTRSYTDTVLCGFLHRKFSVPCPWQLLCSPAGAFCSLAHNPCSLALWLRAAQLLTRKVALFFRVTDPARLNEGIAGITAGEGSWCLCALSYARPCRHLFLGWVFEQFDLGLALHGTRCSTIVPALAYLILLRCSLLPQAPPLSSLFCATSLPRASHWAPLWATSSTSPLISVRRHIGWMAWG